ncbi:hypothetical protein OQA88_3951 [Cercophora sp. LCS_1]
MTLYFTLVFMLLVLEMAMVVVLMIPVRPLTFRRKIYDFISENPIVGKLMHFLRIAFVFIAILFVDSVNRVYRVQIELVTATENSQQGGRAAVLGHERLEVQSRKFYAQRNMYLCGFTLFLAIVLNRLFVLNVDNLKLEEKIVDFKTKGDGQTADSGEVSKLKKQLESKEKDLQTLKKQCEGLQREYNDMVDRSPQFKQGGVSKKDQ